MDPRVKTRNKVHLSKSTFSCSVELGAEGVGFVVVSKQVVDHGARFPGHDASVGVFEGLDSVRGEVVR